MAKPRDPMVDAWKAVKDQTEAKYGKAWEYLSPEQKRGAYSLTAMNQVVGFRHMTIDPQTLVDVLIHFHTCIIDEVLSEEVSP
jgi:hypothetical protein